MYRAAFLRGSLGLSATGIARACKPPLVDRDGVRVRRCSSFLIMAVHSVGKTVTDSKYWLPALHQTVAVDMVEILTSFVLSGVESHLSLA